MSQTSTIFRASRVQNRVLYWPQYKAQLMLQSPTEAGMCGRVIKKIRIRPTRSHYHLLAPPFFSLFSPFSEKQHSPDRWKCRQCLMSTRATTFSKYLVVRRALFLKWSKFRKVHWYNYSNCVRKVSFVHVTIFCLRITLCNLVWAVNCCLEAFYWRHFYCFFYCTRCTR